MANDKHAQIDWERYRQGVRKSTPVDLNESLEEKKKRVAYLEAHPKEWKKFYFPKYFKYPSPEFHTTASNRLIDAFLRFKHWYETRHWARGLSKTTTALFDILFLVLTGKLKFIVYTSSTYDAALLFLTKYQCQLDSNDRLINDYGKQKLEGSWTEGDFTTRNGVRFLALGAGQSPRGKSNEEIRPDCIVVDDFDTDQECRNADIIKQKWDWFETALLPTVDISEPYLILWLGNIIAEDCCVVRAGKISDHCETINIRDEEGVSVWLEKNSEEDIDYILSKMSWDAGQKEYFNNPIRMGQVFESMRYGKCPPLSTLPFVVIYADPATSNKDKPTQKAKLQQSCKAVIIVGSKDAVTFYGYKAYVNVVNNSRFIDWLYSANKYVGTQTQAYTSIENNSLQNPFYEQVLKPLIVEKAKEHGGIISVSGDDRVKPDKFFRIEGTLEPLNRDGHLILNEDEKEDPGMKTLEAQFKSVSPNSKTMDGPDGFEGAVAIIKKKFSEWIPEQMKLGKRLKNTKRY
ncbi:hypothetical protein SAMN05428988_1323 [Chitinophaga sp. YR573]|uniref:hypothetical protein n=1 Tax=Chitinophaga sp. YR573 TaxID=1881040 RepID=UPI0008BCE155|nr:hypothetical protein [Chitinophaga sp. YR573]SEW02035.1 hypothetical protein SAMN05428988_1323 [Chitinophaga sp. YR573]